MKDMRKWIGPVLGGLLLCTVLYAGALTSDWSALLACAPGVLAMVAIVVGLVTGVLHFGDVTRFGAEPRHVLAAPARAGSARPAPPAPVRPAYNEHKLRRVLVGLPEIPAKHARKEGRPREVAQVDDASCTGCGICVPFCPAGCIEVAPAQLWPSRAFPPARVRYDECIGCGICVSVCETLAWDATVMRPAEAVESEEGIVIHARFDGGGEGFGAAF